MTTFRRVLERSGKDHAVLLVLPSGIYHYRIIVDGEPRYVSEQPHVTDERGQVANLLDVHVSKDYIMSTSAIKPVTTLMTKEEK
jgi:5'-AMP-activated protein kinase regulatory beta subunit